ncbi:MAG: hypothetical protein ABI120_19230 [Gemmatimonadaceae bacterium]
MPIRNSFARRQLAVEFKENVPLTIVAPRVSRSDETYDETF